MSKVLILFSKQSQEINQLFQSINIDLPHWIIFDGDLSLEEAEQRVKEAKDTYEDGLDMVAIVDRFDETTPIYNTFPYGRCLKPFGLKALWKFDYNTRRWEEIDTQFLGNQSALQEENVKSWWIN